MGTLSDKIIGNLGRAIVRGCIVGGAFVYFFGGFSGTRWERSPAQERASERISHDFRSPADAYYKPFFWGFAVGAVLSCLVPVARMLPQGRDGTDA